MTRIIITDDHEVVRRGVKHILAETDDLIVIDEAVNGPDLFAKRTLAECDLVLLDISLPGRNGLEVLRQLKSERPQVPVLILSVHPEEQYAVRALRAGAAGYLTKSSAPDELISAIRKVSAGGRYVTTSLAERLADELLSAQAPSPHTLLSDREYQILCLIAAGKPVSEIARDHALSVKTVSTYRSRLLKKMGMKNNAELTRYAISRSLV